MASPKILIARAYAAFNERNVSAALALMSDEVNWPKAAEGGRVIGKEEIRAYWTRQWSEFNVRVEPLEIIELGGGLFDVRVRQLVKSLEGNVLFDGEVGHIYTIKGELIERMDLKGEDTSGPTAAFAKH